MATHFKYNLLNTLDAILCKNVPEQRYASYDFCYGYFQTHSGVLTTNMELSCLQLWSYLASWGMLRGSGKLLNECSMKVLSDIIIYLDSLPNNDWRLDVNDYSNETRRKRILNIYDDIATRIGNIKVGESIVGVKATTTLVTKIMLGTIGCIPAFDDYFSSAFRKEYTQEKPLGAFRTVTQDALNCLYNFYSENKSSFEKLTNHHVIDFEGKQTKLNYKKAKLIDMYGWQLGLENTG